MQDPYYYRASLLRVVDGDTIDVDLDLGFNLRARHRLRLLDVDTPERGQPDFLDALTFVHGRLSTAREITVWTPTASAAGWLRCGLTAPPLAMGWNLI
jgi:endonuclease YncB( thermonuclease family)